MYLYRKRLFNTLSYPCKELFAFSRQFTLQIFLLCCYALRFKPSSSLLCFLFSLQTLMPSDITKIEIASLKHRLIKNVELNENEETIAMESLLSSLETSFSRDSIQYSNEKSAANCKKKEYQAQQWLQKACFSKKQRR